MKWNTDYFYFLSLTRIIVWINFNKQGIRETWRKLWVYKGLACDFSIIKTKEAC